MSAGYRHLRLVFAELYFLFHQCERVLEMQRRLCLSGENSDNDGAATGVNTHTGISSESRPDAPLHQHTEGRGRMESCVRNISGD